MQLPDMNLLVALDALLDEGSVVGAARRMNLSPAAMSRTLTRIREAIGDPKILASAMNLKGGVLQDLRDMNAGMVQVDVANQMKLPAYTGPTARKFVTVPKESKEAK